MRKCGGQKGLGGQKVRGGRERVEAKQGWRPKGGWEAKEESRKWERRKCSVFTVATRGILQGCALVPELFNRFINDLETGDQGDDNIYQL